MSKEKEKWWVCVSRDDFVKIECPYRCRVKVSFEPKGCLYTCTFQDWEEEVIKKKEDEIKQ